MTLEERRIYAREWRKRNPEKVRASERRYLEKNPEKRRQIVRAYIERNRETISAKRAAHSLANREHRSVMNKQWREANRDRINAERRERRKKNRQFMIREALASRIVAAVRAQKTVKCAKTAELVGCTHAFFITHIESLFLPGMSWANRSAWHVDHKRPCAAFDLTDPTEQRRCFHFTNLRPMWAKDNQRKGARIAA